MTNKSEPSKLKNSKLKNFIELIRLKQPTGTILLILPCLFSIAHLHKTIAQITITEISFVAILFSAGALVMRSAGCIINDLIDINIDKKVQRTKNRPLASNKISLKLAVWFLVALLTLGFVILVQFNYKTIFSGLIALILIITYPFIKRISYAPQLFLGVTFNFGVIMASLALTSDIKAGTLILYCATISWTLLYDTIYGFQDIEDDLKIGVKSTAIAFSKKSFVSESHKNPKIILHKIALIMNLFFIMLGVLEDFSKYYFLLILFNQIFITLKIKSCNLNKPDDCLRFFKLNTLFGIIILIAILAS